MSESVGIDTKSQWESAVEHERRRLIGVAFRMLGTLADAEDAVQEAYVRWFRLDEPARAQVRSIAAWLTTATTRICLDLLSSARYRHEDYVGPWLPEPIPDGAALSTNTDPGERVAFSETLSVAMLRVMEHMTPPERVAFVLHDVFGHSFSEIGEIMQRSPGAVRELASSGRRRLRAERRSEVDQRAHAQVVQAFLEACDDGDVVRLTSLLDPSVVLTSDGGGFARAARNPIYSADKVARFVLGVRQRRPDVWLRTGQATDESVILLVERSGVSGVLSLRVAGGSVVEVWIQWNPHKLTQWGAIA
ncbi:MULTISPECIES: RNA polymerase sigma factor SigJ [unclassified Microbacterium]|uniref:RNA polymerase sigma factor SigJ n=1 Tax=unclassified Microbacterium TaxID=2609290 RepID=UPI0036472472